jgi:tetratricopeptide (TPR) repeat protein
MELQLERKKYRCTNFGSCSKADSQEIIELLPNEKPVCPEDGYPLTAIEEDRTIPERALGWVKAHTALVAIVAAAVVLVPSGLVGYRVYRERAPVDAPSKRDTDKNGGLRYDDKALAEGEKQVAEKLKSQKGDAAVSDAKKAVARQHVNVAVGLMLQGLLDQADEHLTKAVAENPADALAYLDRAIIRARQGRPDEALANVDLALKSGFINVELMERDADFGVVRALPGYREVLARNGVKP